MGLFVKQCRAQGAAFRSKQIRKYDQLIAVNGQNLQEATHEQAVQAIAVRWAACHCDQSGPAALHASSYLASFCLTCMQACSDTALFVFRRTNRGKTRSHLKTSRSTDALLPREIKVGRAMAPSSLCCQHLFSRSRRPRRDPSALPRPSPPSLSS